MREYVCKFSVCVCVCVSVCLCDCWIAATYPCPSLYPSEIPRGSSELGRAVEVRRMAVSMANYICPSDPVFISTGPETALRDIESDHEACGVSVLFLRIIFVISLLLPQLHPSSELSTFLL